MQVASSALAPSAVWRGLQPDSRVGSCRCYGFSLFQKFLLVSTFLLGLFWILLEVVSLVLVEINSLFFHFQALALVFS